MAVVDLLKARRARNDAAPASAERSNDAITGGALLGLVGTAPTGSVASDMDGDSTPGTQSISEVGDFLRERQRELLFGPAILGVSGSVATAFVMVSVLWPVTSHPLLLRWVALFLLTVVIRSIVIWRHSRARTDKISADGWLNQFDGTLFINGTVWGLGAILLPPTEVAMYSALMGFGIVALVAGTVATFSAHVRSVFAFSVPAILPYSVYLLLVGDMAMVVLGGALLTFLGFVTSIALNAHKGFLRNFATERENMRLAAQVAAQKHVTETLNVILETRVRQRTIHLENEITARKNTENRLTLYQDIVDTSLDLNSVIDRNYAYLAVNDEYVRTFGGSKGAFIGKVVADFAGLDVFENQLKPLIDRALNGESIASEYWIENSVLGRRYVETRYEPFREGECIVGVISNVRDATQRKQAEETMKNSVARYELAEQVEQLGYWEWDDEENRLKACSEQYARIFDMTVDEALAVSSTCEGDLTLVHPDDREWYTREHNLAAQNQSDLDVELRIITSTGAVRRVHEVSKGGADEFGKANRTFGTLQDITARKWAER